MLDIRSDTINPAAGATVPSARFADVTPCPGNAGRYLEISSKTDGWGGPRANSGGPRANSGGFRPGSGRKPNPPMPAQLLDNPPDDTERWYCVRTFINEDFTAYIQTRLADFEIFAPTVWKPPTITTRDSHGIVRPALPARVAPLFQSYFFAKFRCSNPQWTRILHFPGVRNILSSSLGHPIAVPDVAIEIIQRDLTSNGCKYSLRHPMLSPMLLSEITQRDLDPMKRVPPLPKDSKVRVMTGPMADAIEHDLIGICEMSDGKRVKVLLQIMGRAVSVSMAQSAVEVVK